MIFQKILLLLSCLNTLKDLVLWKPCQKLLPPSSSSLLPPRIFIRSTRLKVSTHIDIQLETLDTRAKISVTALLDSGATGMFLDIKWVKAHGLNTRKLARAIPVYNVDGTLN